MSRIKIASGDGSCKKQILDLVRPVHAEQYRREASDGPSEPGNRAASSEQVVTFSPFRLDMANGCLWRGRIRINIAPKDFAVLQYLVTHSGRLVSKQELLRAVWFDTVVSEGALKVIVRRLRQVLRDTAAAPRFIETAHRRGYWFIGRVQSLETVGLPPQGSHKRIANA